MKKLFIVILICALASFLFVGCFPVVPDEPDPIPTPVLSIDVDVVPHASCADCICYTIENTGDVAVDYELTFVVDLVGHVDIEVVVESEEKLEVGAILSKCVKVVCPNPLCEFDPIDYVIDSISTTYELWE